MKIGHAYIYLMSFCSTFYLKNWRSYDNFKIWPTFWPRDLVIRPLTYKKYRPMWWTRLHVWTKFSDDWSKTATCIATQTNKQTNRQTDRQTVKRTYLPNFCEILASNNQHTVSQSHYLRSVLGVEMRRMLSKICWALSRRSYIVIHLSIFLPIDVSISKVYVMWNGSYLLNGPTILCK